LVILPLLGITEKPLPQPDTIEDDFNDHVRKDPAKASSANIPAE
jgi:ubiquinol-cytochrome c reductase cytochrome b subunit